MVQNIPILDIPISLVNSDTVLPAITPLLDQKKQVFIATPNPEHIMIAQKDEEFKKVLHATDLNIPDGIGVVWALKRKLKALNANLKITRPETGEIKVASDSTYLKPITYNLIPTPISRVTGIDLMYKLCQSAPSKPVNSPLSKGAAPTASEGQATKDPPFVKVGKTDRREVGGFYKIGNQYAWKVGLLGGAQGVAQKAAQNLKNQIPGLDIVALPYYQYGEKDTEIVQKIRDEEISMLFVALGAPKQELFISKYLKDMPNVRLAMGVGGALDVYAGILKRPPQWVQNLNLEWLYRLIQEPARFKRQLTWMEFALRVFVFNQK